MINWALTKLKTSALQKINKRTKKISHRLKKIASNHIFVKRLVSGYESSQNSMRIWETHFLKGQSFGHFTKDI